MPELSKVDQVLIDAVACLAVMAAVLLLTLLLGPLGLLVYLLLRTQFRPEHANRT